MTPLQPPARRKRLRDELRRSPYVALTLLAVLGGKLALCRMAELDCEQAVYRGDDRVTVAVCHQAYERAHAPRDGVHLANALRRRGEPAQAAAIARALLATSAQADALYVLGKLAAGDDRHDEADAALRQALELHRHERRGEEAAKDLLALADAATARKRFGQALQLLDECAGAAAAIGARLTEGYCHLGSARALSMLGHRGGALQEIERAIALLHEPRDRTWIYLAKGDELQEDGEHAQAVVAYEQALALAQRAALQRAVRSAHLNLAYSLAQTARWTEAEQHLAAAIRLDAAVGEGVDRWTIDALIELGRGDAEGRAGEFAERAVRAATREAEAVKPSAGMRAGTGEEASHAAAEAATDELVEAETLRAEIALRRGELVAAERWARRAIHHVEQLRAAQPLLQLRAWVLARHRAPHEVLFASLARAGRAEEALLAFDGWMARASLDALTLDGETGAGFALDGAARDARGDLARDRLRVVQQAEDLKRLLPLLRTKQLVRSERRGVAGGAGERAHRALLALIVARGEIWRITADGSITEVQRVAALAELQLQLDELRTHPGDRPLAESLGERLLPPQLAVATPRVLHVVLDEPLAYLPVAALRRGGHRLGALRPLVRALRPANLTCLPPAKQRAGGKVREPRGPAIAVLADADGSLPGARREAEQIGRLSSRGTMALGALATRRALLAAGEAELLHLAVHTEVDELGGKLRLADGPLSALELAGSGRAPPRVVLATCSSAVSLPGTYSLAMAFLAAGADQVIATLRPIPDDGAAQITAALYRAGTGDLVTALWRLQADAPYDGDDLSNFAVFGDALCEPR